MLNDFISDEIDNAKYIADMTSTEPVAACSWWAVAKMVT